MSVWFDRDQQRQKERCKWIQELRDGDFTVLSWLYMIVSEPHNPLLPEAMAAIAENMETMDINRRLAWNNRFRDSTSMEWFVDWRLVEPEAAKPFLRSERDDIVRLKSLQAALARRALHTRISAALEREIREVLADEENEIPQSLAENILFDLKYVT